MLRTLDDAGKTTWASGVKHLLFEQGFGYAWLADGVGNINSFLLMFKNRLKDCSSQHLHEFINNSSKALHYRHFKTVLNPERYLSMDLPYTLKKAFANFRCSSHDLLIEKGRHMNIDREFRFCPICLKHNIYTIEDEFHFLLLCPLYDNLRADYLNDLCANNIMCLQFFYKLMSEYKNNSCFAISKCIVNAFIKRKEYLDNL